MGAAWRSWRSSGRTDPTKALIVDPDTTNGTAIGLLISWGFRGPCKYGMHGMHGVSGISLMVWGQLNKFGSHRQLSSTSVGCPYECPRGVQQPFFDYTIHTTTSAMLRSHKLSQLKLFWVLALCFILKLALLASASFAVVWSAAWIWHQAWGIPFVQYCINIYNILYILYIYYIYVLYNMYTPGVTKGVLNGGQGCPEHPLT